MGIMKAPIGMKHTHLQILFALARKGECKYVQFRFEHNPWRRESYFDAQIRWLKNVGLVVFTGPRDIKITDSGTELVRRCEQGGHYGTT